ncbi:MAG: kelch repeat-containing protein [Deltaproteobacteria bacterium]|jgi:hypothetical protein|nr:kelch repeat-containing protein [Deltaproteobacteria bacterium]
MKNFRLVTLFLAVLWAFTSCQEEYSLSFNLKTQDDPQFLQQISRLTITINDNVKEYDVSDEFKLKSTFEVNLGDVSKIKVRGYDDSDNLIAYGSSNSFAAVDYPDPLSIYFGEVDKFNLLNEENSLPDSGVSHATLFNTSEGFLTETTGEIFFGGMRDGTPVNEVWFYDPFFHANYRLNYLTAPVAYPAVMALSSSTILLFGGTTTDGIITDDLYYYSTSCSTCGSTKLTLPEDAPPPLTHAQVLRLGPFNEIYNEYEGLELLDVFLLIGGETPEGPNEGIYLFQIYSNPTYSTITIKTKSFDWSNWRPGFVAAVFSSGDENPGIIIAGGNGPAETMEIAINSESDGLYFNSLWNTLPSFPVINNPQAIKTKNNTVIFFGGESSDGTVLSDLYYYKEQNGSLQQYENIDLLPRKNGKITQQGKYLLFWGGENNNDLVETAEMVSIVESDNNISLQKLYETNLNNPRKKAKAFNISGTYTVVFGGYDLENNPLKSSEIFTPNPMNNSE